MLIKMDEEVWKALYQKGEYNGDCYNNKRKP